jgi:predicted nucleotidyltransferase
VAADDSLEAEFQPWKILRILEEEAVDFVVIGGLAAVLHGSTLPTQDVDILPLRDEENLERLARALTRLGARIRTSGEPVETTIDVAFLKAMPTMLNLVTTYGDLDVAFDPAGPKTGFDEWNADAVAVDIGDSLVVRLAALADVIQSKAAANRPKDERALPYLESLQDQIREEDTEANS